jgi:hypothetical protein
LQGRVFLHSVALDGRARHKDQHIAGKTKRRKLGHPRPGTAAGKLMSAFASSIRDNDIVTGKRLVACSSPTSFALVA